MDDENKQLAGALFHTLRSVQKDQTRLREKYGTDKVLRALMERARREQENAPDP